MGSKERMQSDRNKKRITCCKCKKKFPFSKDEVYLGEHDERYVDCSFCGKGNRLKKL